MNDSISVSSSSFSNNSSNNSKSNSLNRSEVQYNSSNNDPLNSYDSKRDPNNNNISLMSKLNSTTISIDDRPKRCHSINDNNIRMIENHFLSPRKQSLPLSSNRRRAKSQILFNGDSLNTLADQNTLLMEDLYSLKKQLKKKDAMIIELNEIRDRLESEMHELSASLFEQAYTMVNTEKAANKQSEKLLKEANGKIDVLQAEVKALKEVVSSNNQNKHLHPYLAVTQKNSNNAKGNPRHIRQSSLNQQSLNQLAKLSLIPAKEDCGIMPSIHCSNASLNASNSSLNKQSTQLSASRSEVNFQNPQNLKEPKHVKTHKRGHSQNDIQLQSNKSSFIDKLFSSSSQSSSHQNTEKILVSSLDSNECSKSQQSLQLIDSDSEYEVEFNELYFNEIAEWRESPELKGNSDFITRVYEEDILPCLKFNGKGLSDDLLESIRSNYVHIEDLKSSSIQVELLPKKCGLSNIPGMVEYKIRLNEEENWIYISKLSRNRVISVCDFFTYLRYIKDGLVKCDIGEIYWNIIDLRRKMNLSRLGL